MIKSKSKDKSKTKGKSEPKVKVKVKVKVKTKTETKAPAQVAKAVAPVKRPAPKADWSQTIKKALEEKSTPPQWPGSGDAWKRKPKVG